MSVFINDRPIESFAAVLTNIEAHLVPAVVQTDVLAVADRPSLYGTRVTVQPRTIRIAFDLRANTLPDRAALLDNVQRAFDGLLEVRTADLPTRVLRCVLTAAEVDTYASALAVPVASVTCTMTAADPCKVDREPILLALSSTRVACPVGTATSAPAIWLYGDSTAVVNPVVIVRAVTGEEVMRLTLTGSLTSSDALLIDCATHQITRYVNGVVQTGTNSGLAWLTSGRFPILDPRDADGARSAWGTLELAATSGTPAGLAWYVRRWS